MKCRWLKLVAVLLLAIAAPAILTGDSKGTNPGVSPPQANFRGNSYGEWHMLWWQWADGFANSESPVWQGDGVVDTSNQSGKVWFLAGYFGDWFDETNPVIFTRKITVPSGTALFFPILNGELSPREWQWNWIEANYPGAHDWKENNPTKTMDDGIEVFNVTDLPEPTEDDLWDLLNSWFEDPIYVEAMSASVDGKAVKNLGLYRAPAPEAYSTWLPEDNHLSFYYPEGGVVEPVVSDGWCLLLEPLSVGKHTVKFKANFGGTLGMDITYIVTVKPGK